MTPKEYYQKEFEKDWGLMKDIADAKLYSLNSMLQFAELYQKSEVKNIEPVAEIFEGTTKALNGLLPKKESVEYLSTIQGDMYKVGQRLKAVRKANGIELKDIAQRDKAEHIERGQFTDGSGEQITARYLIQYCHEIGAKLGPFNADPED